MNKTIIKNRNKFLLVLIVFVYFLVKTSISFAETFSVSLGPLDLTNKERIVGFQLKMTAGRIHSILFVPIGWNINIDNDPSWQTKITGSSVVGAAALSTNSLNNFVIIEKNEFMDLKFDIEADVVVTENFEKERTIHLKMNELILRKSQNR